MPCVDAEERELADERVGHDLEDEAGERSVVARVQRDLLAVLVQPLDRGDVERRGQVLDDGVEELLDALVLERRPADDRMEPARDGRLAQRRAHLVWSRDVPVHVLLHEGVVGLRQRLDEALAVLVVHRLVVGRNLDGQELGPECLVLEVVGLALDEVDDALERLGGTPRDLDRRGLRGELRDHHLDAAVEVRADAVHLVDERDARDPVAVGLAPHGFGLRLDARDGVEDGDGAVEDAQRALDFRREVDVARRVDDVDPDPLPVAGRRGRGDRDAALLLLDHPVHRRGAIVDFADLVVDARVVEDALRRRRLAGVDVGHDADVSAFLEGMDSRHERLIPFRGDCAVETRGSAIRFANWAEATAPGSIPVISARFEACSGSSKGPVRV